MSALNRAYLALGSNIDAERNLPAAVRLLSDFGEVRGVSNVWESAPVGFIEQPNFLNAAVLLETSLTAEEMRRTVIPAVESALRRKRDPGNRNAPRTIDVDLALFNSEVCEVGGSRIPDPEILTRAFLAVPLAELDPDYVHPADGRTLRAIAESLRKTSRLIRRDDVDWNSAGGRLT